MLSNGGEGVKQHEVLCRVNKPETAIPGYFTL